MMYVHYCRHCDRIHMLSGHKSVCPACENTLAELSVSFVEYQNMDEHSRLLFHERCRLQEQNIFK